ncbi:siroheme synthase [Sporolactobacillus sp. THM7-4]|nr:siroheme synthase [Sporolactobacillus sp. THM7-4]
MLYPIMLDVRNRKAVVAGGGRVAARKIKALIDAGASVSVICERADQQIKKWAGEGKITLNERTWSEKDSESAFVIIAATDKSEINREIAENAGPNQLVNVVDDPERGNFNLPAVLRRGKLTITVSTGGASPLLAGRIRNEISKTLDDNSEAYLDFLFQFREKIRKKQLSSNLRSICFKKILNPEFKNSEKWEGILTDIDGFINLCLSETETSSMNIDRK